ncbi:MAG TPA: NAD(P)/FAD-dependent oxidoreductase [Terriglobia bacterium]|nr:NAD(P)/FAD-dependent oxidoreductase [Terriglobia bacterium]
MEHKFDLVVIGTGTAASAVASRCRAAEWSVAIIDKRPFGGTCALRGCDPKKVLVGAADVVKWARRMKGKGINTGDLHVDWQELMAFKKTFTEPYPAQKEAQFQKSGIAMFKGVARFVRHNRLQVGADTLEARYFVIATGMKPALLGIPGADLAITSDAFLELENLPRRVLFIGGGYISFEFAHVSAAAGAETTIVHRGPRALTGFDPDLVGMLVDDMKDSGIRIELNTRAEAISRVDGSVRLRAVENGRNRTFEADLIVHGAGRVPEIDDLSLETAGIGFEERGVTVNEYLQSTSNPAVYAAGDAAASGNLALSPVAGFEGDVVADNLLHGNRRTGDAGAVPTVAFTIPPIASVGLQENDKRAGELRFRKHFEQTQDWYASKRIGESRSGFKVLIEEETERVLGAHLLGHNAEEIINLFALAIRSGIRVPDLKQMIFSYPTHASNIQYML